jgi:hypothetical protein
MKAHPGRFYRLGIEFFAAAGLAAAAGAAVPVFRPGGQAAAFPAPDIVKPGLRLTYYLMTGSVSGSVNGWILDEDGDWVDKRTGRRYATERKGQASHGLIQPTVVGGDGGYVALSQPFYLFNGEDTTPIYRISLDDLVTADSGGDLWMHPRRQGQMIQAHPWGAQNAPGGIMARAVPWRDEAGRAYQATQVVVWGEASRMTSVFDQASGLLLYLSRLTREPPLLRDPQQTLPDSVSYATFLRFRSARQISTPWLGKPVPASLRTARVLSYQGSYTVQGQGIIPTPLAVQARLQLNRRGGDWILLGGRTVMQGVGLPTDFKSLDGPGALTPLAIPPDVLAGLRPGQVIDRDPQTGFVLSVAGGEAAYVILRAAGPTQTISYAYERSRGLLARKIQQDLQRPTGLVMVTDLQLAGIQ